MPTYHDPGVEELSLVIADGKPDRLLLDRGLDPRQLELQLWVDKARAKHGLHDFVCDYHRMQQEHWIFNQREEIGKGMTCDIGVQNRRDWIGPGYFTVGPVGCDIEGDVQSLPLLDGLIDTVICTDVLEHVVNPPQAIGEIRRVLKPGGLLLAASPFFWAFHGTASLPEQLNGGDVYRDYWRFTHEGWACLLAGWDELAITECAWTSEGAFAYDLMRRFEGFGFRWSGRAATGYLVRARKPLEGK